MCSVGTYNILGKKGPRVVTVKVGILLGPLMYETLVGPVQRVASVTGLQTAVRTCSVNHYGCCLERVNEQASYTWDFQLILLAQSRSN